MTVSVGVLVPNGGGVLLRLLLLGLIGGGRGPKRDLVAVILTAETL